MVPTMGGPHPYGDGPLASNCINGICNQIRENFADFPRKYGHLSVDLIFLLDLDRLGVELTSVEFQDFIHDLAHISRHGRGSVTIETECPSRHMRHSPQFLIEQFKLLPRLFVE